MLTQADRAAERRRVKLEEIQRQVKDGFAEDPQGDTRGALALSRHAGPGAAQATSFFVAGNESEGARSEEAYSELREHSLLAAGCPARSRRIFKPSCRFNGQDREIEVGPLSKDGDVVVAILDRGRFEAFRVYTDDGGQRAPARVGHPVYSMTEFS
jgi:hypothetical protein